MSTEENCRRGLGEAVNEDVTGLDATGGLLGVLDVFAEDAGAETDVGGVGTRNDFLLVGPGLAGNDGSEGLFLDDAGVVWWVVDDGWCLS